MRQNDFQIDRHLTINYDWLSMRTQRIVLYMHDLMKFITRNQHDTT